MSSFAHPFGDKTGLDYVFEDFNYVNKILYVDQYNYDTQTSSYKLSNRTNYNYNSTISLSIEQPEIANATMTVFPNPTASTLNINSSNNAIDKIVVFDAAGKTVLQQEGSATQLNVEKLATGLYIIEAYSGNAKFTSKFLKN